NLGTDYTSTDYRAASYDVPVGGLGGWTAGAESYADIGTFSAVSGSCALIRMYWSNQGGINFNRLRWRLGAGAAAVIPSSDFSDPAAAPPANCTSTITGQARSITLNKA